MTQPGTITWQDLTVADASRVRDFHKSVVGWDVREEPIGRGRFSVIQDPAGAVGALYRG